MKDYNRDLELTLRVQVLGTHHVLWPKPFESIENIFFLLMTSDFPAGEKVSMTDPILYFFFFHNDNLLFTLYMCKNVTSVRPSTCYVKRNIGSICHRSVVSFWATVGWSQPHSITGHGDSDVSCQCSL